MLKKLAKEEKSVLCCDTIEVALEITRALQCMEIGIGTGSLLFDLQSAGTYLLATCDNAFTSMSRHKGPAHSLGQGYNSPRRCTALPLGARSGQFSAGQKCHVVGHAANSRLTLFSVGACDWKRIPLALLILLHPPFAKPQSIFDWQQNQDTFYPPFFVFGGTEVS